MPLRHRNVAAFLLLLTAVPATNVARAQNQTVGGRVTDASGQPVAGASVNLVEIGRGTLSDRSGAFQLGSVPPGRYTVAARRIGYRPVAMITDVAISPVSLTLVLASTAQRVEPVNVTAMRTPTIPLSSPLATSVLTGDEVDREGGVSLAHSVAKLAGVRNVSTGQQIGKPMIRGLFGPRVLVLADGSRLEDYSWSDEDGPSIDARIAQRIEVIRGPASVLYGSEALGGVVNVVPADLTFSLDGTKQRREAIEAYGASNNIELGGALMAEGAQSKYAWRAMGTGRFSQNYQTPHGELPNSSFWAFNGEGAFGIRGDHGNTTFRAAHYGGEFHLLESTGPEAGDTEGGPVRQTMDDRLQVTNNYLAKGIRFETKAQFQRHSLAEASDDCVPVPPATTCTKVKDQQAFGLVLNTATADVLAHHAIGNITGVVGVSGMYQMSSSSGPIFIVPSATINSAAAFALEEFKLGQLSLIAGARADTRSLSSDALAQINHAADDRSWSSASGDAGAVFRVTPELSLIANFGSGWRAPTLFDLYANGPNLAEARFEIGDPTLDVEQSKNVEGGVRWSNGRVNGELTAFQNQVDNFIFTTPTSETRNGLRIFRHVQADARLRGAEASLEARLTDLLTVRGSYDFVNGDDRRTDTPLPLMPPPRAIVGAQLNFGRVGTWDRVSLGGDVEVNRTQTRLNPEDFATKGYSLINLDLSAEHSVKGRPVRFDLDVRNALNASYHDFMSRFKEFAYGPGVSVILKASAGAW